MNKKNTINIITRIAILASLASCIGIIDKIVSASLFPFLPGIKIGIANVIILVSLLKTNFKESLTITIIKSLIVGLLFGGITSFIIGGISTVLSFLSMYILYYIYQNKLNIISISVVGGFIHINSQLIIIRLIYDIGREIYLYGLILIIISLVTSIMNGYIAKKINNMHKVHNLDI